MHIYWAAICLWSKGGTETCRNSTDIYGGEISSDPVTADFIAAIELNNKVS